METIVTRVLARGPHGERSIVDRFLKDFTQEVREEFKHNLLEVEKSALTSADPMRILREALLDYTESWRVNEIIDDIKHHGEEEDEQTARSMSELLGQRFDYAKTHTAYWTGALGTQALEEYLEANVSNCFNSGWWHAYKYEIFDRTAWLEAVVRAFAVVQTYLPNSQCKRPDDVILDQWTSRMLDARKKALEDSVDFVRSYRREMKY